jgi:uncharacterized protein (DUF2141 family)
MSCVNDVLRLLTLLWAVSAAAAEPGRIVVTIVGFGSDDGQAMVALFDDTGRFPMDGELVGVTAAITGGQATVTFEDVAAGIYAVSVFHDENGNGKLDTRFMGIPKEPIGVSNDAKGRFGPPRFEDARVEVGQGTLELTINLAKL